MTTAITKPATPLPKSASQQERLIILLDTVYGLPRDIKMSREGKTVYRALTEFVLPGISARLANGYAPSTGKEAASGRAADVGIQQFLVVGETFLQRITGPDGKISFTDPAELDATPSSNSGAEQSSNSTASATSTNNNTGSQNEVTIGSVNGEATIPQPSQPASDSTDGASNDNRTGDAINADDTHGTTESAIADGAAGPNGSDSANGNIVAGNASNDGATHGPSPNGASSDPTAAATNNAADSGGGSQSSTGGKPSAPQPVVPATV